MDGLPLLGLKEPPIHMLDDGPHWGAGFIARGEVNIRVSLAVFKLPEDSLWIFFRALRWSRGREEWRTLDTMRGKLRC